MTANRYAKWTLPLCAAALFLAGCGGSGGVNQGTHDTLQMDYDAALVQLMETEGERDAAQAEVRRLTALIGAETDAANTGGSLYARINAAQAEATRLQGELDTATDRVTALTNRIGSAADPDSLQGRLAAAQAAVTRLTGELNAANTSLASLRGQLTSAQQAVTTAQQQAQQARQEAAAQIAKAERTREASQRAQYMQAEMLDLAEPIPLGSDIVMNVPTRGSLRLSRPGTSWRPATLGGSGLRSTTMPLTSAVAVNTGKTVVYSDRELSRPLLEHYGSLRDPSNLNQLVVTAAPLGFAATDDDGQSTDGVVPNSVGGSTAWQLTLPRSSNLSIGIPKTVAGVSDGQDPPSYSAPTGLQDARMADRYPVSLFGISGQLTCAGCQVTLTPAYIVDPDDASQYVLQTVAVGGTALRFDPNGSPSVHFHNGSDFLGDFEYMVFGYWREDPISPASPYDDGAIGVFAQAFTGTGTLDVPGTINATYHGTAVGMYVEQELSDPIDTHRQGEFSANAILTVAGGPDTITGTIRDFSVTPTGGSALPHRSERWVVRLMDQSATPSIVLNNESGTTAGGWNHAYVQAHQHAGRGTSDATPPGVTGTFNARIGNISRTDQHEDDINQDALHIIGAFGAHR